MNLGLSWSILEEGQGRMRSWFLLKQEETILTSCLSRGEDLAEENNKDWSFTSHVGEDLRGADLSGANLRRAILDRADLEGADLSGADLRNASLKGANLMKAALDGADLRGARMVKARLGLSNLQGARLDGADMRGIRGKYAIWRGANWWDATMDESLTKALSKKWPRE